MTKAALDLLERAKGLPLAERAEVAVELLASLDGEPDEAVEATWAAEIAARAERVRGGKARGRPWSEIRSELERSR